MSLARFQDTLSELLAQNKAFGTQVQRLMETANEVVEKQHQLRVASNSGTVNQVDLDTYKALYFNYSNFPITVAAADLEEKYNYLLSVSPAKFKIKIQLMYQNFEIAKGKLSNFKPTNTGNVIHQNHHQLKKDFPSLQDLPAKNSRVSHRSALAGHAMLQAPRSTSTSTTSTTTSSTRSLKGGKNK